MRENARNLRKHQTDAENRLWYYLRSRRLVGYKFRRQHPIGPFIADFVCLAHDLIVEVDGGQHASRKASDRRRTEYLEARGFRVVRFWNNQVLHEIHAVLDKIHGMLESDVALNEPSPRPSPSGRGGKSNTDSSSGKGGKQGSD